MNYNLTKRIAKHRSCPKCGSEDQNYLPDTRPVKHADSEPASDQVLKDMAIEDALDAMGW